MAPSSIVLIALLLGAGAGHVAEAERNKGVARQLFEEVFGPRWRLELIEQIHTPDFVSHGATHDADLDDDRRAVLGWKAATPDLVIHVERMVAEGDMVAVHWVGTGTNTGEGNGFPATGRRVTARGMTFFRLRDGRIAEEWNVIDMLSVLRQAGLLPETGGK